MQTAIVLGTFDGLHSGHRAVIEKARGFYTVAVTFDIPPKAFFGYDLGLLMSKEDKAAGLKELGVDRIYSLDLKQVADISPSEFFEDITERFSPTLIVCGFNYRFGKGALGDTNTLYALCKEKNIKLVVVDSVGGENPVSSSAIRTLISNGDVKKANEQIFGGFGFSSRVIRGDKRGRVLGFPTVNQKFPDNLVKPKFGVYESRMIIDGRSYKSITNLGIRPTYKTDFIGCETFIGDFEGDVYGKNVTLKLIRFIRPERKFKNSDELERAVKADIESVLGLGKGV